MGFTAWAMEELFDCEYWADTNTLIKNGAVFPVGSKRPDFVCGFKDGSLGVFEAKGTTGTAGGLSGALADGKLQTAGITATDPISLRAVVGCALGGGTQPATVVILDPPGPSTPLGGHDAEPTNLTADIVRRAAKQMRTPSAFGISPVHGGEKEGVTLFRGPRDATGATREIKLTNEFKEDKGHGWLEKAEQG